MAKRITQRTIAAFRNEVYSHFDQNARTLPWRSFAPLPHPWKVVVSEIMLQQTQVPRVVGKFIEFISLFPTTKALAEASVGNLLACWKGLGYNRRALNLQRAAIMIEEQFAGEVPSSKEDLLSLPGIGPATSSAIRVYAFDQPEVYIETNIRSVFLHHFFSGSNGITDEELRPVVQKCLDHTSPAKWYSALMDYGSEIKSNQPNPSRRSAHHKRQSPFEGSNRQLRSKILMLLMEQGKKGPVYLANKLDAKKESVMRNVEDMCKEGFLIKNGRSYQVKGA